MGGNGNYFSGINGNGVLRVQITGNGSGNEIMGMGGNGRMPKVIPAHL